MLGQNVATFARPPAGGGSGGMGPSLDLNFVSSTVLDSRLTFTRAGASNTATRFDTFGNLQGTNTNVPRFDYGPGGGTTPLGLLIEESRTNSIRNPRAEGATPGTPGTPPTNWALTTITGLTITINGVGTENGIPYIEIRVNGTAGATGNGLYVRPEPNNGIAAVAAQIWTHSVYVRMVAGSTAGINGFAVNMQPYDSTPSPLGGALGQAAFTPTNAALATQRVVGAPATMPASTAFVLPQVFWSVTNGAVVDCTLRIGGEQAEIGGFATSLILPVTGTPAATTRNVETVSGPIGSWYNQNAGSVIAEWMTYTIADPTNQPLFEASDGTSNNRVNTYIQQPRHGAGGTTLAGTATASTTGNSLNANTITRSGAAFDNTGVQGALSGTLQSKALAATMPVGVINTMRIGMNTVGSAFFDGWIRRIRYYPRVLSAAELTALTT